MGSLLDAVEGINVPCVGFEMCKEKLFHVPTLDCDRGLKNCLISVENSSK